MNPEQTDTTNTGLPGIRDYEIRINVCGHDGNPSGDLIARLPAGDQASAETAGEAIATGVYGALTTAAGLSAYTIDFHAITATDVDDTPAPAEVAAELEHVRRVLAGLAAKFPLLLQLTADEYNAADPDGLQHIPMGDAIAFVVPAVRPEPASSEPAVQEQDEALLLWPHGMKDTSPGGEVDPDVRHIRARNIGRFQASAIEILVGAGTWRHTAAGSPADDGNITITLIGDDPIECSADTLFQVRPATTESYGADLGRESITGKELLHAGRWWTITGSEFTGPFTNSYKVDLVDRDDKLTTTFNTGDPLLVRRRPDVMWTGGQPR